MSQFVVIGLGNRFRCDDGAGPVALEQLKKKLGPLIETKECQGDVTELMETWKDKSVVYLIDTILTTPAETGKIYRIDALNEDIPVSRQLSSSHILGLSEIIQMSKSLGQLPKKFLIYGVVGSDFNLGTKIGPQIQNAIKKIVEEITEKITNEVNHA